MGCIVTKREVIKHVLGMPFLCGTCNQSLHCDTCIDSISGSSSELRFVARALTHLIRELTFRNRAAARTVGSARVTLRGMVADRTGKARVPESLSIPWLQKVITVSTSIEPSVLEIGDEEHEVVARALKSLSRAVVDRLLIAPFLTELRTELNTLRDAAQRTGSLLESLLLTRDQGHRGMENVADSLLPNPAFAELFALLRAQLRAPAHVSAYRQQDPSLPPQLREVLDELLAWTDPVLAECGERTGSQKRGRPAEHPAIVSAINELSAAGFSTARIKKTIGNEIAAVREHTRRTRNGKSYEGPHDLGRTVRSHRGKKSR
jgi:hypothetical protein